MLDSIDKIIADKFVASNQSCLIESNTDHKGRPFEMKREIRNCKNMEYKLFRFDPDKGEIFPFFKEKDVGGAEGLRKICDYILFVKDVGKCFAILLEMKRGKTLDPKPQLRASEIFIDYLIKSTQRVVEPEPSDPLIRKILLCDNRSGRRTTKPGAMMYDSDNYMEYVRTDFIRLEEILK